MGRDTKKNRGPGDSPNSGASGRSDGKSGKSYLSRGKKDSEASHRLPRVEREIREIVGRHLISGFRGDLSGIASVTRVIVSGDLRQAKILVTLMTYGQESKIDKKADIKELQRHAYEFQEEVSRLLKMRQTPRLTFLYDEGYEHAMKVENILRELDQAKVASGASVADSVANGDANSTVAADSEDSSESQ